MSFSPFSILDDRPRATVVAVIGLTLLFLAILVAILFVSKPLSTPNAPDGMRSLYLAFSDMVSDTIIKAWQKENLIEVARLNLMLDYLFLVVYSTFFALLIYLTASTLKKHRWWYVIGVWLVYGQWAAAFFDLLENSAVWWMLGVGGAVPGLSPVVYWLAITKWTLVVIGWIYLLGGGLLVWGKYLLDPPAALTAQTLPPTETKTLDQVLASELSYITGRRELALKDLGEDVAQRLAAPSQVKQTTIGLAFSGGGMRAGTFNLGIVQELARFGILPWVDYLSTVSGGGYTGACLSALLSIQTISLPAGADIWDTPLEGTITPLNKAVEAEIIGKPWWYVTYREGNKQKDGWITAHPREIDKSGAVFLVYENPQTNPTPITILPVAWLVNRTLWYRIRYKTDKDDKVFSTGWVEVKAGWSPRFRFDIADKKFPFDPAFPAFEPSPGGRTGKNHQLYHLRLNGNIIAPRRGMLKQDTLRLVGAVVSGVSRMLFVFSVLFLIFAALHYVLAGLLATDISQKIVFTEQPTTGPSRSVVIEVPLDQSGEGEQVTAKLLPPDQPSPTPSQTVPADQWFSVIFLQYKPAVYASEPPPSGLTIPPVYWIYLATGALGAVVTYLYIHHFYAVPDSGPQPDSPGLSVPEYKAKLILRDCTIISFLLLVLLTTLLKTSSWLLPSGTGETFQLFWLWTPAVFMVGQWSVTTFVYLFWFQEKLWKPEFRSIISGWQGINSYGLVAGVLFAALALPYYIRLPGEATVGTNVTLLVLSAVLSGAWSYVLAGNLAGSKSTGLLEKLPAGLKRGLLNILAVVLLLSIGLLFGTLFEQMPTVVGSSEKTRIAFYFLTLGAIVLGSIFLLFYWARTLFRQNRILQSLFEGIFRLILSLLFLYLLGAVVFFALGWFNLPDAVKSIRETGLPFSWFDLVGAFLAFPIVFGGVFVLLFVLSIETMLVRRQVLDWTRLNNLHAWGHSWWVLGIIALFLLLGWMFQYWVKGFPPGPPWNDSQWLSVLMIGVFASLLFVLISQYVNLNRISFHYFYRDRLIDAFFKTYRVENNPEQVIPERDQADILVHEINPDGSTAPYHLVMSTLNLPGSKSLTYKDSRSEPFVFSRFFCGSGKTGYYPSHLYQGGQTKLARAAAVSGAAISSTLGQYTFLAQALVMTMFNVRLGYWMDNPQRYHIDEMLGRNSHQSLTRLESNTTMTHESSAFWAKYLWYELSGTAHDREILINLSDGGHTDNLGLYPLLQRRCRLIIVGDAGCDPDFSCDDLARVIRRIYSEENVVIEINLDQLKPGPNGFSRQHFAVGTIHYPPASASDGQPETGWLIYLKPAITGDEEGSIKSYWWNHRVDQFPHQTTADQFYDENQFEAYRHLGEHTVRQTLRALNHHYLQSIAGMPAEYDRLYKFGQKLGKDENYLSQKFASVRVETMLAQIVPQQIQQQLPPTLTKMGNVFDMPSWLMTEQEDAERAPVSEARKPPGIDPVYEKMVDEYVKKLHRAALVSEKILTTLLAGEKPLLDILRQHWAELAADPDLFNQVLRDLQEVTRPPVG